MNYTQKVLELLIPIPPKEKRSEILVPIKLAFGDDSHIKNKIMYVAYLNLHLLLLVGFIGYIILLLDLFLGTFYLIDKKEYLATPFEISRTFCMGMQVPSILINVLMYLRSRVGTQIRDHPLDPSTARSKNRNLAILIIGFANIFAIVAIIYPIHIPATIHDFFNLPFTGGWVIFVLTVSMLAIPAIGFTAIVMVNYLEKLIRCKNN